MAETKRNTTDSDRKRPLTERQIGFLLYAFKHGISRKTAYEDLCKQWPDIAISIYSVDWNYRQFRRGECEKKALPKRHGRRRETRTDFYIAWVQRLINENPAISLGIIAQETGVSKTNVLEIVRRDLNYVYHVSRWVPFSDNLPLKDKSSRTPQRRTVRTAANIDRVRRLLAENPSLKPKQLGELTGITEASMRIIIIKDLHYCYNGESWVPNAEFNQNSIAEADDELLDDPEELRVVDSDAYGDVYEDSDEDCTEERMDDSDDEK